MDAADGGDGMDPDEIDDVADEAATVDTNCADASTNALVFDTFNVHGMSVTETMMAKW